VIGGWRESPIAVIHTSVMIISAILIITLPVFIHAFWNFLRKRQNPSAVF